MKKHFFFISILFLNFLIFAQDAEIVLPEVTTFISKSMEQKLVITAEEIEAAHFEDLSDVIESTGIQNLAYGPYGMENKPSVRGFTDETVRVVVDGICVNNAQYGTFDFSSINMATIERIEIVRGGFTEGVEDEGAVGGVIYITTKKTADKNRLSAELAVKTFFNSERPVDSVFQKLNWSGNLSEATFLTAGLSAGFAANKYYYKIDKMGSLASGAFDGAVGIGSGVKGGPDGNAKGMRIKTRENSQVTDGHGNMAVTHYFGNGNYFSVSDSLYGGIKNTPGKATSKDSGVLRDYNNDVAFALWNPAVAGLFNLKNNLAWFCKNRFYKNDSGSEDSTHHINTLKYSGSVDFTSLAGGRLRQLAGLSFDYTNLDSTNDGKHNQFSGVVKETTKFALGRGGKGGWTFSLPLAFKFCINDDKVNAAFVPKLGAAWESAGGLVRIFSDAYRMVQFPNMDDLFWQGGGFKGNPDLKPEFGWGADLGLALKGVTRGGTSLSGGVTLFSDYYKDKIKWGSGTTENLSSAYYFGLDFNFEADFLGRMICLSVNGEYLYNALLDESELTYGKQIMWTPDFVCSLNADFNFELIRLGASAQYTGLRYTSNMNVYYLQPYVLLNFVAEGAEIAGHFTPYVKLDNALNWLYQSVEGYPMPGISLTMGARYIF